MTNSESSDKRMRQEKVRMTMARGSKVDWYLESNHLFIPNFIEPVTDALEEEMQILYLWRPPSEVSRSFIQRGSIPGCKDAGVEYLIDPYETGNILPPPEYETDESLCLWYCAEIEARAARHRKQHPRIPWHFFKTEWLNDRDRICSLLDAIGIVYDVGSVQAGICLGATP